MVNVGEKPVTHRVAEAVGVLYTRPETVRLVTSGSVPKGDPLSVARVAAIQAAKRTSDLIPLCHPLPVDSIAVDVEPDTDLPGIRARAKVEVHARTGVEMEALTAVAVALLTAYDMLKAVDRHMQVSDIRIVHKSGGTGKPWPSDPEKE